MANLTGSLISGDASEGLSKLTYLKQELLPLTWVAPFYSTCIWYLCFELLSCALAELPLDLRPSSSPLLNYKSFGFSTWTAVSVNSEYKLFSSLQPEPLCVLLQSISQTRHQQKEGKRSLLCSILGGKSVSLLLLCMRTWTSRGEWSTSLHPSLLLLDAWHLDASYSGHQSFSTITDHSLRLWAQTTPSFRRLLVLPLLCHSTAKGTNEGWRHVRCAGWRGFGRSNKQVAGLHRSAGFVVSGEKAH